MVLERLLVHKSKAILLALQSAGIGCFCYHKSKAWVISRMARDVTRHRPAKSFLTSCVTNKQRIVRYGAKAV